MLRFTLALLGLGFACAGSSLRGADDLLIADFESDSYAPWNITGDAFGPSPALGALDNQMAVSGYRGNRLINTFFGGDESTGTATSPEFTIERSHIAFLIGGGPHQDTLGIQLLVDDQVVRSSTGTESEHLLWTSWDVKDLRGRTAPALSVRPSDGKLGAPLCRSHHSDRPATSSLWPRGRSRPLSEAKPIT
ncbi:MAG: hypothetical protein R3B96_21390 [Pirellulaceae bacterium]